MLFSRARPGVSHLPSTLCCPRASAFSLGLCQIREESSVKGSTCLPGGKGRGGACNNNTLFELCAGYVEKSAGDLELEAKQNSPDNYW